MWQNICNAIAWLYLAYRMTKEEWIYNLDIIIYATVLCVPAIIAIAIAMWIKKQKNVLQCEDETPMYMMMITIGEMAGMIIRVIQDYLCRTDSTV